MHTAGLKILERDILSNIRKFLRLNGWYVIRVQQGMGCHKGLSDLIVIRKGVVVFIEVKKEKGFQSPYQKIFEAEIKIHGGNYFVARSINDVREYLGRINCGQLQQELALG